MKENYLDVSIQEAIDRLHSNEDMMTRLIKMTLNGDMLIQAEQAFADANMEVAQRAIHTIKGTAANVGLSGLSRLALEIETKIKTEAYLDFEALNVMKEVWADLKDKYGN